MSDQPRWLKTAARRSAEHAWLLGHVFEQYRRLESKSSEDIATRLGCSVETLAWIALCRRPDEERFTEELGLIAERFHVDPSGLAEIIRHVESLDVIDEGEPEDGMADTGLQMAAHDRHSDEETDS